MSTLSVLLAGLALALGGTVAAQLVLRVQTGPLALVGVLETHLLAVAVLAAILGLPAVLRRGRVRSIARLGLLGVTVLAIVRAGGELWSPAPGPTASGAAELVLLSWNLERGSKAAEVSVEGILDAGADVAALQELTPEVAAALEADPRVRERYPYRILEPHAGVDGMGLLSALPLLVRGSQADPLVLRAGLLVGDGITLELLDVHPYPPRIAAAGPVPVGVDTRRRDEGLRSIAGLLEALDDPGLAVVVGDLNATPTEAGLAPLREALADAHGVAGSGPGFTWRPTSLERFGLGALRIDYVLTGDRVEPRAASADCSLPGDHCRLVVTLSVLPGPPRPASGG